MQWGSEYVIYSKQPSSSPLYLSASPSNDVKWVKFSEKNNLIWRILPPYGFIPPNPGQPPLTFLNYSKKVRNTTCQYSQQGGQQLQGSIACQNINAMLLTQTAASQYYQSLFKMLKGYVNSDNVKTSSKVDKTTTQNIKSQADAVAGSKYSGMFSGPNEGESTFSGIPPTIAVKTAPVDKSVPLTTNYQSSLLNDNDRKILKLYVFIIPSALILILIGVIALRFTSGLFIRCLEEFIRLELAGYIAVGLIGIKLLVLLILPNLIIRFTG